MEIKLYNVGKTTTILVDPCTVRELIQRMDLKVAHLPKLPVRINQISSILLA